MHALPFLINARGRNRTAVLKKEWAEGIRVF